MAFLAASTNEVRPGAGSDVSGGCCTIAATTNYTLQNSAQVAVTDAVAIGSAVLTSVAASFPADCAGNSVYLQGGTGSLVATRRRIVTRDSATQITVDANVATGTGITCNMGGALATIGELGAFLATFGVAGMVSWIKAGTDTLATGTNNVSGGTFNGPANAQGIMGYNATRGDLGNVIGSASRPIIDVGAITTITVITSAGTNRLSAANIKVDGQANASVTAFGVGQFYNCTAVDSTTGFAPGGGTGLSNFCSAIACGTGFSGHAVVAYSFTNDCTTVGFTSTLIGYALINCVSINDAIACTSSGVGSMHIGCTFHESTGDGASGQNVNHRSINSLYTSNGGDAIDFTDATTSPTTALIVNMATVGNGAIFETSPPAANIAGAITISVDPYLSEATDDLSPNNTAGGGASLRGAGADLIGQVNDNNVVGAVGYPDAAGASGGFIIGG